MTDFVTPRTWTVGELVTKAMLDEQVRDNMNAIWVGTTAGDMDYYVDSNTKSRLAMTAGGVLRSTAAGIPAWLGLSAGDMLYRSATVLTNLAIGTSGKILTSNGSAPTWELPVGAIDKIGLASRTSVTELTAMTWADVSGLTTTLALTAGATYTVIGLLLGSVASDQNGDGAVRLMIDGTEQTAGTETTLSSAGAQFPLAVAWLRTGIASGNRIVKAQYQQASGSLYVRGNLIAVAVRE